jgi:hypothetical protein
MSKTFSKSCLKVVKKIMLQLSLLTTPLSRHAKTNPFDHASYSQPNPVTTGIQTICVIVIF